MATASVGRPCLPFAHPTVRPFSWRWSRWVTWDTVWVRPAVPALVDALTGRFDEHHAQAGPDAAGRVDAMTDKTDRLTWRVGELIAAIPATCPPRDP